MKRKDCFSESLELSPRFERGEKSCSSLSRDRIISNLYKILGGEAWLEGEGVAGVVVEELLVIVNCWWNCKHTQTPQIPPNHWFLCVSLLSKPIPVLWELFVKDLHHSAALLARQPWGIVCLHSSS